MSYNLLADKFLPSRIKHLSSKENCLDADFRAKCFLAEFQESGADIICLQEVSTREIGKLIEIGLAAMGYKIVPNTYYKKKSDITKFSRRALMNHHRFWSVMTAYKADKFSLVDHQAINYYDINYYEYN